MPILTGGPYYSNEGTPYQYFDPDDFKDFSVNWALNKLEQGESVAASEWEIDSGLEMPDPETDHGWDNDSTYVWLQNDGTAEIGDKIQVVNRITTSVGREYTFNFEIWIKRGT